MNYDITFCSRDCNNEKCERNFNYIDKAKLMMVKPYVSISNFDDCEECIKEYFYKKHKNSAK